MKTCPQCKSKVASEVENCPNCPHSFKGVDEGIQENRTAPSLAKPVLFVAALLAAFFGAWKGLNYVIDEGSKDVREVPKTEAIGLGRDASKEGQQPLAVERPEEQAPPAEDEQVLDGPTVIGHGEKAPSAKEWKLRGVVYDLVSLKPVPKMTLVFKDAALNRRYETMTDAQGRYRVAIPPLPDKRGYAVSLVHPDYAAAYVNPDAEHVADKEDSERREMAKELARSMDAPYTVQAYSAAPVVTDFYAAPLKPAPAR